GARSPGPASPSRRPRAAARCSSASAVPSAKPGGLVRGLGSVMAVSLLSRNCDFSQGSVQGFFAGPAGPCQWATRWWKPHNGSSSRAAPGLAVRSSATSNAAPAASRTATTSPAQPSRKSSRAPWKPKRTARASSGGRPSSRVMQPGWRSCREGGARSGRSRGGRARAGI
ncbi:hypothetical protein HMPREF0731_2665, partial [Pseudoroseomonas cervicalis ATCC 49957]